MRLAEAPTCSIPARPGEIVGWWGCQAGACKRLVGLGQESLAKLGGRCRDYCAAVQRADQRVVVGPEQAESLGPDLRDRLGSQVAGRAASSAELAQPAGAVGCMVALLLD